LREAKDLLPERQAYHLLAESEVFLETPTPKKYSISISNNNTQTIKRDSSNLFRNQCKERLVIQFHKHLLHTLVAQNNQISESQRSHHKYSNKHRRPSFQLDKRMYVSSLRLIKNLGNLQKLRKKIKAHRKSSKMHLRQKTREVIYRRCHSS
jgi:hypothetical protein